MRVWKLQVVQKFGWVGVGVGGGSYEIPRMSFYSACSKVKFLRLKTLWGVLNIIVLSHTFLHLNYTASHSLFKKIWYIFYKRVNLHISDNSF